ncbi:EAL domain-containing protein [Thioclava sp.]|uniref:EAL domain-containing protein n=1 Tax=Thioclava sp. TaxID=1933450 RepID=UPI003241C10A
MLGSKAKEGQMKNRDARAMPVHRDEDSPLSFAAAEQSRQALAMVRAAIDRQDVMLAYQPVIQTCRPDRPAFYEGLIRVLDDRGRIIPAKEFINAIERTEVGRKLDCLSLELGLKALLGQPDLRLAINMSARSIGYAPWTKVLNRGLAVHTHRFAGAKQPRIDLTEQPRILVGRPAEHHAVNVLKMRLAGI